MTGTVGMYFRQPPHSADQALEALHDAAQIASLLIQTQEWRERPNAFAHPLPDALANVLEAIGLDLGLHMHDATVLKAARGNLRIAQLLCRLLDELYAQDKPYRRGVAGGSLVRDLAADLGQSAGIEVDLILDGDHQTEPSPAHLSPPLFWSALWCSGLMTQGTPPGQVRIQQKAGAFHVTGKNGDPDRGSPKEQIDMMLREAIKFLANTTGWTVTFSEVPRGRALTIKRLTQA